QRGLSIRTAFTDWSEPFWGFTVLPAPVSPLPLITAITPQTAVARTSFTMTVTGTNLSGATAARFDGFGIVATIQPGGTATSLSLLVTVGDPLPLGSRTLTITTPGGTSAPFSGFTVLPPSSPPSPPSSSPQRISEVEDGSVQTGYLVITPDQNTSA